MKCNTGNTCAVPCDGKTECAGGEDENGCKSMWATPFSLGLCSLLDDILNE